jgi:hypothetical protein
MGDKELTLADAERIKTVIVEPLIQKVGEHFDPIVKAVMDDLKDVKSRVGALESHEKRALIGWSVYASAAAMAISYLWSWVKSKARSVIG